MAETQVQQIGTLLASENLEELREGLSQVKREVSRLGVEEARPYLEMVTSLFYIDPLDRPELMPALEEAISLLVGFGDWIIPTLLQKLDDGDIKAQMAISHALGRIGADAIYPLAEAFSASSDPGRRAFILFAMGKIKSPKIVEATEMALQSLLAENQELRDTATRALGKFFESIHAGDLPASLRAQILNALQNNLADTNPGIRAKAVRSLGKMARFGHLSAEEKSQLKDTLLLITGKDQSYDWDRAYAVRKEAEEALGHL